MLDHSKKTNNLAPHLSCIFFYQIGRSATIGNNLFNYVITSIDVIEQGHVEDEDGYDKGAKYVEFHGEISKAKNDDTDVAYLFECM